MTSFLPFTVGVSFENVGFQILLLQNWFWDTTVLRICFEILLLQNLFWDTTVLRICFEILLLQNLFWDTTVLRICFEILLLQNLRYYCFQNLLWDFTVAELALRYYCFRTAFGILLFEIFFEILLFSEFALRLLLQSWFWDIAVLSTMLVAQKVSVGTRTCYWESVCETGSLKCLIWSTEFYGAETWHFET